MEASHGPAHYTLTKVWGLRGCARQQPAQEGCAARANLRMPLARVGRPQLIVLCPNLRAKAAARTWHTVLPCMHH